MHWPYASGEQLSTTNSDDLNVLLNVSTFSQAGGPLTGLELGHFSYLANPENAVVKSNRQSLTETIRTSSANLFPSAENRQLNYSEKHGHHKSSHRNTLAPGGLPRNQSPNTRNPPRCVRENDFMIFTSHWLNSLEFNPLTHFHWLFLLSRLSTSWSASSNCRTKGLY